MVYTTCEIQLQLEYSFLIGGVIEVTPQNGFQLKFGGIQGERDTWRTLRGSSGNPAPATSAVFLTSTPPSTTPWSPTWLSSLTSVAPSPARMETPFLDLQCTRPLHLALRKECPESRKSAIIKNFSDMVSIKQIKHAIYAISL